MSAYWFIIVSALIAYLQHLIFNKMGLRRVTYSRQFDRSVCFEGDEVHLVETIANEKRLPMPWLRVESLMHASLRFGRDHHTNLAISAGQYLQNHRSFFSLMPCRRIRRTHRVTATRRGSYTLSTVTLSAGDLFGIGAAARQDTFTERLIVYPLPLLPDDLDVPARGWQGEMSVRRWVVHDPFRRIGVRPYRSGDSLRLINWQATARTGEMQVHELDTTADYKVLVVLNVEDHADVWRDIADAETIEHGIRIAAGIANHLIRSGMEAGFGCNGCLEDDKQSLVFVPPGGGEAHLYGLLETMALLKIERQLPFADYLLALYDRLEEPTDIVLLSTYEGDRVIDAVERLTVGGHRVSYRQLVPESEAISS